MAVPGWAPASLDSAAALQGRDGLRRGAVPECATSKGLWAALHWAGGGEQGPAHPKAAPKRR